MYAVGPINSRNRLDPWFQVVSGGLEPLMRVSAAARRGAAAVLLGLSTVNACAKTAQPTPQRAKVHVPVCLSEVRVRGE